MEITNIRIKNHKSIKEWVSIDFKTDLPTILIGKNGSGKTSILEALEAIAAANNHAFGNGSATKFQYEVTVQLSEQDIADFLPSVSYDKEKCQVVAFNRDDMKVCGIRSDYLVPFIKKQIKDVRSIAEELQCEISNYEHQLSKLSHSDNGELPLQSYEIVSINSNTTNYDTITQRAGFIIQQAKQVSEKLLKCVSDKSELIFATTVPIYFTNTLQDLTFKLKYVKPDLPVFEQKFITINETAIKREITKINKSTEASCKKINEYMTVLNEHAHRLCDALVTDILSFEKNNYFPFFKELRRAIGRKCTFLKSENNTVIFRDPQSEREYLFNDKSYVILETYLRKVYAGKDRDELLQSVSSKDFSLSEDNIIQFEEYLNRTRPKFENDMYSKVSVENTGSGNVTISLHEKTGDIVDLNMTSAGRRWYFTYYFIKNTMEPGDVLIIDEPAVMLHPTAQKEILKELCELESNGIKVIYSTHSPYLIPDDWKSVQFVSMENEGTIVSTVKTENDYSSHIKKICGNDIFNLQELVDKYNLCNREKLANRCYELAREKFGTVENAASELNVSKSTLESWRKKTSSKKFREPKFENILLLIGKSSANVLELFE